MVQREFEEYLNHPTLKYPRAIGTIQAILTGWKMNLFNADRAMVQIRETMHKFFPEERGEACR